MNYTDIDKQFCDDFSHIKSALNLYQDHLYGKITDQAWNDLRCHIHQIYDQAKSEQREEDAMVVEDFCLQGITFDDKVSIEASFKEKMALISIGKLAKAIRSKYL